MGYGMNFQELVAFTKILRLFEASVGQLTQDRD